MQVIDLSHPIATGMPVYPGSAPPNLETIGTVAANGHAEKRITLNSHTGTHIDAPAHMLAGARTLDVMDVGQFIGRACVINVSALHKPTLDAADLTPHSATIARSEFVLLRTDHSQKWGTAAYFEGFPALTAEAAEWLSGFGLKGFGVDAISVDRMDSKDFPVHKTLLASAFILIENLTNLHLPPSTGWVFSCLPLKLEGADGSPVRAVALLQ